LAWEKELLGLYLSGHPLDKYKAILEKREMNIAKVLEIIAEEEEKERLEKEALSAQEQLDAMMSDAFKAEKAEKAKKTESANKGSGWSNKKPYDKNKKKFNDEGTPVIIAGIIEEAKEIATKKDPSIKMMFLRIADLSGVIEAVVFPKTYELLKNSLVQEKCIIVKGKTSNRNGTPSIIIDTVKELN
jgi:DNA polymerase-3 subunit alpha